MHDCLLKTIKSKHKRKTIKNITLFKTFAILFISIDNSYTTLAILAIYIRTLHSYTSRDLSALSKLLFHSRSSLKPTRLASAKCAPDFLVTQNLFERVAKILAKYE